MDAAKTIDTLVTRQLGISYPIVGAPMFLWSNLELVAAVSDAGGIGMFPALNFRPVSRFDEALDVLSTMTDKPYGVNVIVNRAMEKKTRDYLSVLRNHRTPVVVTSLGSPMEAIKTVHGYGGVVWCDVVDIGYARKVMRYEPDAIVGVVHGAGGHHGLLDADMLIPMLKEAFFDVPVLQGGLVADAQSFIAALDRGADGVYMGTRFLASEECSVPDAYKQAIVDAGADDIVSTNIFSGAECTAIRTKTLERFGVRIRWPLTAFLKWKLTKKLARGYLFNRAMKITEEGAGNNPYNHIFVAGKTVERIDAVAPVQKIIDDIVDGYHAHLRAQLAR